LSAPNKYHSLFNSSCRFSWIQIRSSIKKITTRTCRYLFFFIWHLLITVAFSADPVDELSLTFITVLQPGSHCEAGHEEGSLCTTGGFRTLIQFILKVIPKKVEPNGLLF
jgi:hypothetical protein